jgi:hypothetical protein
MQAVVVGSLLFERILCINLGHPSSTNIPEVSKRLHDIAVLENRKLLPECLQKCVEIVEISYYVRRKVYFEGHFLEPYVAFISPTKALLKESDNSTRYCLNISWSIHRISLYSNEEYFS